MRKTSKIKMKPTERGFRFGEFRDTYGQECIIQESSLAEEACIWLGKKTVDPKIMSRDAAAMGREDLLDSGPEKYNGWVAWPVPEQVQLSARMHLNQKQAKELILVLEHFVKTGSLPRGQRGV